MSLTLGKDVPDFRKYTMKYLGVKGNQVCNLFSNDAGNKPTCLHKDKER